MTEIYLGYPPENVKAWILAHSAPAAKTPVWGQGVWHVKRTSGQLIGRESELTYTSDDNVYCENTDFWKIQSDGTMSAFNGDAYVDDQGKVDTTTSSKQTLTITSDFDEIGTFTVEVWWTES